MSRSRGLPSPTAATPLTQVLDALTDPGSSGNSDPAGVSGASGSPVTENVPGASDSRDTAGTPGNPDTSDTRGTSRKPKPAVREHVKLRRDLAAEMRDAVWFLTEHGRPRVQLGELLDEAIEAWLTEAKKAHNEGHDFPHRGPLR
jgi:hypothetical protein